MPGLTAVRVVGRLDRMDRSSPAEPVHQINNTNPPPTKSKSIDKSSKQAIIRNIQGVADLGDVVGEHGVVHEVDAEGEGVQGGPPARGQKLLDEPALFRFWCCGGGVGVECDVLNKVR